MIIGIMIGIIIIALICVSKEILPKYKEKDTYEEHHTYIINKIIIAISVASILIASTIIISNLTKEPETKFEIIILLSGFLSILIWMTWGVFCCSLIEHVYKNTNIGYKEYIEVINTINLEKNTNLIIKKEKCVEHNMTNLVKKLPRTLIILEYIDEDGKPKIQKFPEGSKEKCIKELYESTIIEKIAKENAICI